MEETSVLALKTLLVGISSNCPPVNEKPVFDRVSQKAILHKLGSTTAINIWQEVVYDELIINERQKTDTKFSEMLDSVRCGFPTEETVCALKERVFTGSTCGIAGENRPSGAKTQNELFISPYLALSSGACGASIRASVPEKRVDH